MKNSEERLEELVGSKAFEELTPDELLFVISQVTEAGYRALRDVELRLNTSSAGVEPDANTFDRLQKRFREVRRPSVVARLSEIKIPAYAAVLLVVVAAVIPFKRAASLSGAPQKTITRVDTVYITKVDTLVREKVVFRQASVALQIPIQPVIAPLVHDHEIVARGVSMNEKEDLNRLLVSDAN